MLSYHGTAADGLQRSQGALAVLGRGLGAHEILLELMHRAITEGGADDHHATRLVLLINTSSEEGELLLKLAHGNPRWAGSCRRLVLITSEMGVEERAEALSKGGVFVVNARLLVTDFLTGRVVVESVDGILVNHAHSVGDMSADAFVLRMFRRQNRRGFIRAVSDKPDLLTRGTNTLDKVLQRCFIQNLEVWPRIRREVQQALANVPQPDVVQRTLRLPARVQEIHRRILSIIQSCLDELNRDQSLSLRLVAVNDCLSATFESELRQTLDPVWHSLGPRTRRMVQDLSGLRRLLVALLRCDAVEFHHQLESVGTVDYGREAPAWVFSEDAQALFKLAKSRVYEIERLPPGNMGRGISGNAFAHASGQGQPCLRRTLEPNAKWQAIIDIIEQTISDVTANPVLPAESSDAVPIIEAGAAADASALDSESDLEIVSVSPPAKRSRTVETTTEVFTSENVLEPRLLVVAPDDRAVRSISSVLHRGAEATLRDSLLTYLKDWSARSSRGKYQQQQHTQQLQANVGAMASSRATAAGTLQNGEATLLAREAETVEQELKDLSPQGILHLRRLPDGRMCHPRVDVVAADSTSGSLEAHLRELRPHAVVLCEPYLMAIRALEVYCAESLDDGAKTIVKLEKGEPPTTSPGPKQLASLKAYLLVFDDSAEKSRFQQTLVQEGEAIDELIRARSRHMVRIDDGLPFKEAHPSEDSRSSRRGGGSKALNAMIQPKVIVDMREFRSAVPFMLYLRGLVVDPITIPVGDYVLSRDICVERKAIPDLVQSLSSGRLYQQAQNMCHLYANPCLLIEFDPDKSFSLQNSHTLARRDVDVSTRDLLGKLSLLVLTFPKLRLIWSPSQRFTAEAFLKLKAGRHQPDAKSATRIDDADDEQDLSSRGADGQAQRRPSKLNSAAFDVLRKLPGVTPRNMHALAKRGGSLAGIAQLSEAELTEVMGRDSARQLYHFLRDGASEAEETASLSSSGAQPREEAA
eukprot:TRINITY_DN33506_c0_g1_i1.p1 TRINITY_DN33506_c0_g1~~TRINITY_DN33506_c0_g1_i1.p1  ORF type:complete len:983 (-),score=106.34 TRINITY_DN33506_c0_g1_i1:169-3117(-)